MSEQIKKVTVKDFTAMKVRGEKIAMLTAYDYTMATLMDQAGVDALLVGDSASNVMQGNATTLPITVDEMIIYGRSVARAAKRAHVVIDMPFGSYQIGKKEAAENAVRIIRETGADSVKLEGGESFIETISYIIRASVPVMGHLGLTPQSVNCFGGYSVRAKEDAEAEKLLRDVKLLENAGCYALVLEKVPAELAQRAAASVRIPIIGIGAGNGVDGQVLVSQDMLGANPDFKPKFVRHYANMFEMVSNAVKSYSADVKNQNFPNEEESY
ncbi:MAG: 3-methyl-2-oxobutanoate hydroxymethyltransferase [Paludibacteraceae bacterium]|jgi:3-methyl-2-oxobutanoate hydroxymethyltransferase|nr:3-methyl-2-oxobutanoate hydroxymethyltransferase [Paludibacteraceae bacterium]